MPSTSDVPIQDLWQRLVATEDRYYVARMALYRARKEILESGADLIPVLRGALRIPGLGTHPLERHVALHLLAQLGEPAQRELFPQLVELASWDLTTIHLTRELIRSLDAQWLAEHLPQEVDRVLGSAQEPDEYRRLAELLELVRSPYLAVLVARAAASLDPELLEVADDYQGRSPPDSESQ